MLKIKANPMKKILPGIFCFFMATTALSQSFTLHGDGKWYRVATMGGDHSYFEYLYSHPTGNNPSITSGEIDYINAQNFMVQHHQTMGYQTWNQPQFALINFGNASEVWVKATPGVADGSFTILRSFNGSFDNGSVFDTDLSTHGGTLTIYDKLKDNANIYYSDVIVPAGHVSIGTGNIDPSYSLAVKGNIHAQQVVVELANWPDYVFKKDYQLMPLAQVKSYVDQNHHLPDLPAAIDLQKDGLNLGEMNKLLTRKVEELTLYLIEKDKEIEQLKLNQEAQLTKQKVELDREKDRIDKLEQEVKELIIK